jgi:hypothetical protein
MRHPSWITIRCETPYERTHVDLPAILGSGFDLGIDAEDLARHAISACDDAGQDPQDVAHCARMTSLLLGSVPDLRPVVHDCQFVSAYRETGRPSASTYDPVAGTEDEWLDGRADPAVVAAVGLLTPLWFRPEPQSSGNWRCMRAGFEEIEVMAAPADPIEIMRALEAARKDRPWNDR